MGWARDGSEVWSRKDVFCFNVGRVTHQSTSIALFPQKSRLPSSMEQLHCLIKEVFVHRLPPRSGARAYK